MDLQLKGKTAVVTAASKGIGKAIALRLAGEGVNVAICARGEDALRSTEAELRQTGVNGSRGNSVGAAGDSWRSRRRSRVPVVTARQLDYGCLSRR
jgi:NAD(P)-dependent dehydrogenase (short-subunit alcohol dehydrogenase family)